MSRSQTQSRLSGGKTMINQSEKAGLDEEQTNELKEAFDLFDEDGSGTLGVRELHVLLQAIGRNMELKEIET